MRLNSLSLLIFNWVLGRMTDHLLSAMSRSKRKKKSAQVVRNAHAPPAGGARNCSHSQFPDVSYINKKGKEMKTGDQPVAEFARFVGSGRPERFTFNSLKYMHTHTHTYIQCIYITLCSYIVRNS